MYKKVLSRFENWVMTNYDMNHPKILEKYEHTQQVLEVAEFIAIEGKLSEEDLFIARVAAILHDCARFPQIKLYDSFMDTAEFNHSIEGAKMLRNGLLKEMLPETRKYDDIIITAVELHGALSLPDDLDEQTEMQCSLLRDADRTNLFPVCIWRFDMLFWFDQGGPNLSPKVRDLYVNHKPIAFTDLTNQLDMLALRFGLINQYKSTAALEYIKQQDYVNILTDLFLEKRPFYNKEDVEFVRRTALGFLE